MSTSVRTIYARARSAYRMDLRGGGTGLDRSPSWVYLAEDLQNVDFLKGGEFVITTGLFTRSGATLMEFVRTLAACRVSAVLVNVGRYLTAADITDEVVRFCDARRIPLLTVPWEIHLVDVMRDVSLLLVGDRQENETLDTALTTALQGGTVPREAWPVLETYGFGPDARCRLAVIEGLTDEAGASGELRRRRCHGRLLAHGDLHVFVLPVGDPALPDHELVDALLPYGNVCVGTCRAEHGLRDLAAAYREATFSLAAARVWQRRWVGLDELGVLRVLAAVPDEALLEDVRRTYLGPLETYDAEHATQLVHTLQVYLLADCSPLGASARLPAHRNTVVHRINRVKEILGVDLDRATTKFNLLLALYIREYLSLRGT